MSKYEKMLTINKARSNEKIETAKAAIHEMVAGEEKISIPKLMEKTGLSRGFFYKNPEVRREMDKATEQQGGLADPRRKILDQAMEGRMELMRQQMTGLKKENEDLKKENRKLQKVLNKKDLNILKNL